MSDIIAWEVSKALAKLRFSLEEVKTKRNLLESKSADSIDAEALLLPLEKSLDQAEENLSALEEASYFHLLSAGAVAELRERRAELDALNLWHAQEVNKLPDTKVMAWVDLGRFGKIEPLVKATRESTSKEMRKKYIKRIALKAFEIFITCSAVFAAAGFFS